MILPTEGQRRILVAMVELVKKSLDSNFWNLAYQDKITGLLARADIKVHNSRLAPPRPWDVQVHNPKLFARILGEGTLGLGEAYMDGWWDCEQLDELFARALTAELASKVTTWSDRCFFILAYLTNRQIGKRLLATAASHYDIGNDLYQRMLDPRMIYTCGYWQDANNLEQAQQHKLELVARKLGLEPGMRVLDIGCGWGGAADYMAQHHGVEVVGITLSTEQIKLASERIDNVNVTIKLLDFRNLNEKYDRIYSLGMFEHIGFKNYSDYFRIVDQCLVDRGLFLLHTIGHRITSFKVDPWIDRYIFPNSILPSAELINRHASNYFTVEDWHCFGLDYHQTLLSWDHNCRAAWDDLPNYPLRFRRMWHYFLMCSAGSFKARRNHLWQIVFSKGVCNEPYQTVRSAI